ncbi:kinase-like protein [Hypoxylon rubiginosum]|uniref:Kinase-like protein n=1 Tax=Hypoxylon rubiginosum TaxID=110542 RepID=A0ACB9YZC7_9PEZI|nr:kinase-like protein [Hypoxylon rubiginosum]
MATRTRTNSDSSAKSQNDQHDVADVPDEPLTDEVIEYDPGSGLLGLENVQMYNKGGHHPVHLDDIIDGRFQVYHKLGNGGFGIVWFCRDLTLGKWRAVKIMAANYSSETEEKIYNRLLDRHTREYLEENHIMIPLERFWLEGPNGRHRCFVMPVCGWPVSDWRLSQRDYKPETDPNVRDTCRQIVQSLFFLHSHGICHGDFTPRNILMKIEGLDDLDEEEILDMMEEAHCYTVKTESGRPPGPRAPEYSVQPVDSYWCRSLSTKSIAVIDLGQSYFMESPPRSTGIPSLYAPPEILFDGTGTPGPYSDIWSLACTLFEVRTGTQLFASITGGGIGIPVLQIESYLGPLPNIYNHAFCEMLRKIPRASISPRQQSESSESDQKQNLEPEPEQQPESESEWEQEEGYESEMEDQHTDKFEKVLGIEMRVLRKLQRPEDVPADQQSSEFISWRYSQEEVADFADLLRKMLRYNPAKRIDIGAVASHPWNINGNSKSNIHPGNSSLLLQLFFKF